MTMRRLLFASTLVSATVIGSLLVGPAAAKKKPPPTPPPPPPPPSTSSNYVRTYANVVDGVKCDVTPEVVQTTSDGGSIVLALSSASSVLSSPSCSGVNWVVKLDAAGAPQWQELVGCFNLAPGYYTLGVSLQQTSDGGYVIGGGTLGCGLEGTCFSQCGLVEKLDPNGRLMWSRVYKSGGGDRESTINQIRQTSDGGFVAAGSFRDADDAIGAWILKLDGAGNAQWQRKLGPGGPSGVGRNHVYFNSVQQTGDGGYFAGGEFTSYLRGPLGDTGVLAVRFDANGNVAWQRGFLSFDANDVPTASVHALSSIQTSDGGYLVTGNWGNGSGPLGACCRGALLLKLDSNGQSQWQKALSGGVYCFFNGFNTTCAAIGADVYSVHQTADGGYSLAGSANLKEPDGAPLEPWLAKVDASGNVLWQHLYYLTHPTTGRPLSQYFASSTLARDGGFLALGFTGVTNPFDLVGELFAVRTDSAGNVGACNAIRPASPLNVLDPGLATIAPALPVQATSAIQGDVPASRTQANSIGGSGGRC